MSVALLAIATILAICGWGFLLASALSFHHGGKDLVQGSGVILFLIDIMLCLGFFTMLYVIVKNWRSNPEARRLLYTGVSCLAAAAVLGVISSSLAT